MKKISLLTLSLLLVAGLKTRAQEPASTLSLTDCISKAVEIYPQAKQKRMIDSISAIKIENLNINYLPRVDVNGQFSYQSDVVAFPEIIPGMNSLIDPLRKDTYKLTLDVNQTIYDAGITSIEKDIEEINRSVDQKMLESDLYKVKERVIQVYFSIIILKEQINVLKSKEDQIRNKLREVESKVRNGVLLASNLYILEAELLKLKQQTQELQYSRESALNNLSIYTGVSITDQISLQLPDYQVNQSDFVVLRPEYQLFDINITKVESLEKLTWSKTIPKISGFGQLGMGAPGLNFLSNDLDGFYIIGARISWKPWNWNESKNTRKSLLIQSDMIKTQKETYDYNLRINLETISSQIKKYSELIATDQELIILREKITQNSASQLSAGIITSTDYLNDLNEETISKANLVNHQILLSNAKINYQTALGKL